MRRWARAKWIEFAFGYRVEGFDREWLTRDPVIRPGLRAMWHQAPWWLKAYAGLCGIAALVPWLG